MIVSFSADYLKWAERAPTLDLPNEWMNYFITSFKLTQLLSREKLKFAGRIENTFLDNQLNLYR